MEAMSPVPAASADPDRIFSSHLELTTPPTGPLLPLPAGYRQVRLLVRCHGEVLGYLDQAVPTGGLRVDDVVGRSLERFSEQIDAHLRRDGVRPGGLLAPPTAGCVSQRRSTPSVTLVVCTRNRAEILASCLTHLAELEYPALDVIVVDNAPDDDATLRVFDRAVGADRRFLYVTEPMPGLSRARNRGLAEARGEILVYTDDDVTVEPEWISALVRGFERDLTVGCVTGLVATASIDGPAERYFDSRVSWAHNFTPRLYDLAERRGDNPVYPYSPGIFGTGANFAFRKAAVESIGGFDEALGAGTLARGGEDLDAFVGILRAGWTLAYEPNAVVWHHHRSDLDELRKQMYGYGTGLSAFVTKYLLDRASRPDVLRRIVPGTRRLVGALRAANRSDEPAGVVPEKPKGLILPEIHGIAVGPLLYLRARRALRRAGRA